MSFVAPSSNIVTVAGSQQKIASGTIAITLNFSKDAILGTLPLTTNYSMELLDVATIEVDFDYLEDIGDINDFQINVPSIEFEIRDDITNTDNNTKDDLFKYLLGLGNNDLIVAKVEYNSSSDYYYCTRKDVEYSYITRRTKFRMLHPLKYSVIGFGKTFQTSDLSPKYVDLKYDDGAGTTANINEGILVRDFIETYLNALGDSVNVVYESTLFPATHTDSFVNDQKDFALYDLTTHDFGIATNIVKSLALSECAIVGNILGYGFYIPRNDRTQYASLTANDLESLEIESFSRDIRYVSLDFTVGDSVRTSPYPYDFFNVSLPNNLINSDGANNVTITYGDTEYVTAVAYDTTSSRFEFGNYQYGTISTSFKDDVLDTYKRVFGIFPYGIKISGKVIGVDKLKPYQAMYLDSSIGFFGTQYYRPSYLKYDLLNDVVEFEAYTMFQP